MANRELVQQKLPQHLRETAMNFNILDSFLENEADLVVLVLQSRSLSKDEEKQSWFNLVPLMNGEQIEKLRDILTRERDKINEIEEKYERKKVEIKEKYQARFDAVAYQKRMDNMQLQEDSIREKEEVEAEDLLKNL